MSGFSYHVVGLVPAAVASDRDQVGETLRAAGYATAPLTSPTGRVGVRVVEDDGWGISAWFDDDDDVREMHAALATGSLPPGVTPDDVAGCPAQLAIWSDDDDDMMNAHVFEELIQLLKEQLGILLWDNVLGEWR